MPHDAPKVKLEATRGYGAEVVQYTKHEEREQLARGLRASAGHARAALDHPHIVAGQGTSAKELIEDAARWTRSSCRAAAADHLGCAVAAKHLVPKCKVIGVEPAAGDDATQSFKQKRLVTIPCRTRSPTRAHAIARRDHLSRSSAFVDDMLTVTDDELKRAMFFLWERMKIVVEPTGALAYAALHTRKATQRPRRPCHRAGTSTLASRKEPEPRPPPRRRTASSRGTMSATVQPARTARSAHPRL